MFAEISLFLSIQAPGQPFINDGACYKFVSFLNHGNTWGGREVGLGKIEVSHLLSSIKYRI